MNLAEGVINTFVEAGIRTAAGRMVSVPQCHSSYHSSVSVVSFFFMCQSPLHLATGRFKPGSATAK